MSGSKALCAHILYGGLLGKCKRTLWGAWFLLAFASVTASLSHGWRRQAASCPDGMLRLVAYGNKTLSQMLREVQPRNTVSVIFHATRHIETVYWAFEPDIAKKYKEKNMTIPELNLLNSSIRHMVPYWHQDIPVGLKSFLEVSQILPS